MADPNAPTPAPAAVTESAPIVFSDDMHSAAEVIVIYSPDPRAIGIRIPLGEVPAAIGRQPTARSPVAINDTTMSRDHASVQLRPDGVAIVQDLQSKNHTYVMGAATARRALLEGDVLRIGSTLLVFRRNRATRLRPLAFAERSSDVFSGLSFAAERVRQLVSSEARSNRAVHIVGEAHTGRSFVAEQLHAVSDRPAPLVHLSCRGVQAERFRREVCERLRLQDPALVTTIVLRDLAALPHALQLELHSALDDSVATRTPGACLRTRLVSIADESVSLSVDAGDLRRELAAAIADVALELPPLRERREDVLLLMDVFLQALQTEAHFLPDAAEALVVFPWRLNLHELQRAAAAVAESGTHGDVAVSDLPEAFQQVRLRREVLDFGERPTREFLLQVLEAYGGNLVHVAHHLRRDRRQVYRWLETYGIDAATYRG